MKIYPNTALCILIACASVLLAVVSNRIDPYGVVERCEEKFCKVNVPTCCVHGKCFYYWVKRDTLKPGDIIQDPFK